MAVYVRQMCCWSHLDPVAGPIMAHRIGQRLHRRLALSRKNGEPWVMLTLHYDRTPYEDGEELWDEASRLQHLNKAMQRIGKAIGKNLTGRWIAKAEFQGSEWLHFHVIITGVSYMKFDLVKDAWGHGGCYVSRGVGRHAYYLAKYCTKESGDSYPDWLYHRSAKAVKLYRTSPGFWKALEDYEVGEQIEADGQDPLAEVDRSPEVRRHREYVSTKFAAMEERYGATRTIAQCIDEARKVVRCRDDQGRAIEVEADAYAVGLALRENGSAYKGKHFGWDVYEGTIHDVKDAVTLADLMTREMAGDQAAVDAAPEGGRGRGARFTCYPSKNSTGKTGGEGVSLRHLLEEKLGRIVGLPLFGGSTA